MDAVTCDSVEAAEEPRPATLDLLVKNSNHSKHSRSLGVRVGEESRPGPQHADDGEPESECPSERGPSSPQEEFVLVLIVVEVEVVG